MMTGQGGYARGLAEAYMDGAASIPYSLLRSYRALKLSDTEAMLLLQLIAFRQLEQNEFPTIEQLQERMGSSSSIVGQAVQKLMKAGIVSIDEVFDSTTGVQSERYNLSGLFQKLAVYVASGAEATSDDITGDGGWSGAARAAAEAVTKPTAASVSRAGVPAAVAAPNLFVQFEQEFGRPLTPMEVETINGWLDQDRYADELIRFALKESVFAGKLHFRYIDRILLEWSRNRVTTVEEARLHAQKFRTGR